MSLEPVGSKPPTFSTDSKISSYVRSINQSFGLLCQAQAYPVPLIRLVFYFFLFRTEPIGSKAPSLASNAESITFKHSINSSFGLLCQAQAYPVPLIRFVTETYRSSDSKKRRYFH